MAPPYPSQLLDNRNTLKNNKEQIQTQGHINIHTLYVLAEQLRWLRKLNDDVESVHLFTPHLLVFSLNVATHKLTSM